jgi:exopolysaccharide biosynthesis polyprenyl glycosylphosphotransferase
MTVKLPKPSQNIGQRRRWIQTAYVLIDVSGLWIISYFLYALRFDASQPDAFTHFLQSQYPLFTVFQSFLLPSLLAYYGQYGTSRGITLQQEWLRVGKANVIAFLGALAISVFLKIEGFSRLVLVTSFVLDFIYCAGWRTLKREVVQQWVSEGYNNERTLIIGAGEAGYQLAKTFGARPELGVRVIGFLDVSKNGPDILGKLTDFRSVVRREFVDSIFITISSHRDAVRQLLSEAKRENVSIHIVPELYDLSPGQISIGQVAGIPYLLIKESPNPIGELFLKRLIDVIVASVGFLILSPILLLISAVIKLDSRGPVLYKGVRIGYKGKEFRCYKFRTMVENAEQLKETLSNLNKRSGPLFKIENDPRVTRVGKFLRRYSIDEIMQLWNVMKGDMSLVGPRPPTPDEVQKYQPHQLRRLSVRPGMTGLWQIRARKDPAFDRALRYDLFYIDHWSPSLDFWILLQTIPVVFRGDGE